jgi:two-component system sensor histidine kinase HydH
MVAALCWILLSALTVFIMLMTRDRARLIRDNDNERLFSAILASLRDDEDFGSAIEATPFLRERITGFGIYGEDLALAYQWGTVPPVFDAAILDNRVNLDNLRYGRYTIADRQGYRVKFILHTRGMFPVEAAPPSPQDQRPQWAGEPQDRRRGRMPGMNLPPEINLPPQERIRPPPEAIPPPEFGFRNTLDQEQYLYIDVTHPAYWRTQTLTAIIFPFCELIFLALIFLVRRLYLKNQEYGERIEAQKNLVVLGTAAGTLAHEIKNPLLSIRLQTGILKKLSPEKGREELAIINEEVDRLSALIYRVNDFLRDAVGQREALNTSGLLEETARRLCGRNILTGEAVRDGMILMDPDRARSVFENLIRNALESGGPPEAVEAAITRKANGRLIINILDRGQGIAPGDLGRVFDPFFTRKSTGTGIGLCISKRFVEAAGGTITVENREGGGALVRLNVPECRH